MMILPGEIMKRLTALLLLLSLLTLTSCKEERCAKEILYSFCLAYPMDARIYSSLADEGSDGYIDSEMLVALYNGVEPKAREYALVLYGKVSTVREIGVFITNTGDERKEIFELASDRLDFLDSFAQGEGFVRKYRTVTVYGFVDDSAEAIRLFDEILS